MPCNSDHMQQTPQEAALQITSKLLKYARNRLGEVRGSAYDSSLEPQIAEADHYYAKDVGQIEVLCALIENMTEGERERVVYEAHNKDARALANWYEKHQEADIAREAYAKKMIERTALREAARAKLTPEELEALRS